MVLLKATHKDIENLVASASLDKPYLVYSYKKGNPNLRYSYNVINDREVYICWLGNVSKEDIALLILNETKTKEIITKCIEVRVNGKSSKFENTFYTFLQPTIKKLNESIGFNESIYSHSKTKRVDPDAKMKVLFNKKKDYYADKRSRILTFYDIESKLSDPIKEYRGKAKKLLTKTKAQEKLFKGNFEIVTEDLNNCKYSRPRKYLVPKGCSYLVFGSVEKDYYEKFKEDAELLDKNLALALDSDGTLYKFIRLVEDLQDNYEDDKDDAEIAKKYSGKNKKGSGTDLALFSSL